MEEDLGISGVKGCISLMPMIKLNGAEMQPTHVTHVASFGSCTGAGFYMLRALSVPVIRGLGCHGDGVRVAREKTIEHTSIRDKTSLFYFFLGSIIFGSNLNPDQVGIDIEPQAIHSTFRLVLPHIPEYEIYPLMQVQAHVIAF